MFDFSFGFPLFIVFGFIVWAWLSFFSVVFM